MEKGIRACLETLSYRPKPRYLRLADGDIYDRKHDMVIQRDTLHQLVRLLNELEFETEEEKFDG